MAGLKAQVTIEVLTFSAIFLLAFMVVLLGIQVFGQHDNEATLGMLCNELNVRFASALTTVYTVGEGFSYRIKLPADLGGKPYAVYLKPTSQNKKTDVFVVISENGLLGKNSIRSTYEVPFYVNCSTYIVNKPGIEAGTCILPTNREYILKGEKGGIVRVI